MEQKSARPGVRAESRCCLLASEADSPLPALEGPTRTHCTRLVRTRSTVGLT